MTFEPVVIEYIRFQTADIITTSAGIEDDLVAQQGGIQNTEDGAFTTGGVDLTSGTSVW